MKIIKFKLLIFIYILIYILPSHAQVIKSKDGVSLGERNDFVSSCIKGANKKLMNINGVEVETNKYCACVCDNLIPTINSWEMVKALKENKLLDLFLKDNNIEILMKCIEGNFKLNDDYKFGETENPEIQRKVGIRSCVNEIMNNPDVAEKWTEPLAEKYCECAISKLFSAGYSYKDILEIGDENSKGFNEIALPCLNEVVKTNTELNSLNRYNTNDIKGGGNRCLIPIIDYLNHGYKIKINVSGVTKYFLFDTGASDLLINSDLERELLLEGVLKKENYLNKTEYTLANNLKVKAQMVKLDNIIIGDYTINNVVVAIIEDGALLCGKSILDKFKKWEIDQNNKLLILFK